MQGRGNVQLMQKILWSSLIFALFYSVCFCVLTLWWTTSLAPSCFLSLSISQALQSNLRYSLLPKRLIIGKRLAQCLHPALPSGVHLKALETYEVIFKIIGTKWLAKDLFIYRWRHECPRSFTVSEESGAELIKCRFFVWLLCVSVF